MTVEHTMDKSAWLEGPWQTEPDYVQWIDFVSGYTCEIKRHAELGHLCGYVTADTIIPYAENVEVHGGVSYENGTTYGFDCAHAWDVSPRLLHRDAPLALVLVDETYRDMPYVIQECTKLARQLWELS